MLAGLSVISRNAIAHVWKTAAQACRAWAGPMRNAAGAWPPFSCDPAWRAAVRQADLDPVTGEGFRRAPRHAFSRPE